MPIFKLTHAADALNVDTKTQLAQRFTEILLTMEGNARTRAGQAFATVLFEPVAAGDWWVGGRTDDMFVSRPGRFIATVTAPEGYLPASQKTWIHAAVTNAITDVLGQPGDANLGGSILVVIDEVPEGNWGARGRTIGIDAIAQAVGLDEHGERHAWVCEYFAAKARQYAAFDYPDDTSGLRAAAPQTRAA